MTLTILKSKIHRACVTQREVDYVGSVTIDSELMDAVGILENEQVHVWNLRNGSRLVTYALRGEKGIICLNGAAAHLSEVGDRVIIASFAQMSEEEAKTFKPRVVVSDEKNKIEQVL